MFGAIARIGSKLVRGVANIPAVKSVAKQTAIGAAVYGVGNAVFGGGSKQAALPALPSGGMPLPIPGMGAPTTMGDRGIFQNDPNVIEAVKPWAISKANLKTYYRAPKGFVIVYDQVGDPYALPRKMAMWLRLWKPSPKPPISVGDYQSLKRADRTAKKVKKILSMTTRVDKNIGKGGRVLIKKKAAAK